MTPKTKKIILISGIVVGVLIVLPIIAVIIASVAGLKYLQTGDMLTQRASNG